MNSYNEQVKGCPYPPNARLIEVKMFDFVKAVLPYLARRTDRIDLTGMGLPPDAELEADFGIATGSDCVTLLVCSKTARENNIGRAVDWEKLTSYVLPPEKQ